jgi:hypothetical protein
MWNPILMEWINNRTSLRQIAQHMLAKDICSSYLIRWHYSRVTACHILWEVFRSAVIQYETQAHRVLGIHLSYTIVGDDRKRISYASEFNIPLTNLKRDMVSEISLPAIVRDAKPVKVKVASCSRWL